MRLGVLATHPIQYHAPLYRALAERLDLEVFFAHRQTAAGQAAAGFGVAFEWDVPLTDGYAHTFLVNRSRRPSTDTFSGTDTPGIRTHIREGRFDAFLVNGWYAKSHWQAITACWQSRTPLFFRGDSHLGTTRSRLRRGLKEIVYRAFVPRFDGYLVVGKRTEDYLLHYGAKPERLSRVPHFVDNAFFRLHAARAERTAVRALAGATKDTLLLLFAGKLIDVKRPLDIVAAAARLRANGGAAVGGRDVRIAVAGAGPLEGALHSEAERLGVPLYVAGFQNQTAMPAWYAAADILVLPSESETWGLVVNEAMACGVPVVVSDAVGCAPDLVTDVDSPARTGAVFPIGDVDAMVAAIARVALHLDTSTLRQAVADRIDAYSLEAAVEGTIAAIDRVHRPSAARPSSLVPA